MTNTLLWVLAFVGIVVIYIANPILRLFGVSEPSEASIVAVKSVGIFMSAVALLILYMTGRFG